MADADYYGFTEDDMAVNESLGYPKAYAKLCRGRNAGPYTLGPPFAFTPYALQPDEVLNAEDLEFMFPVIDPKAKPTAKLKIFISLLWRQLNHLGNAGFDPAVIRVDPYGNVLYYHADSASPLAWDIDHWFPCSRGGLTVPSNLRILQWQACKKKHNKLEFLIPWWDFQLGISVNQFLSIFASSNSDFRRRAFSFLFSEGENEEINPQQAVDSHSFPHHFVESMEKHGLAPAAIVVSKRESRENASVLKSLDYNRRQWPNQASIASRRVKPSKENENPEQGTNTYQAIVMARDSLKQKEEATKMKAELQELDNEVSQLKRKNEEDKLAIQDLELVLIKRRRRAEKCRRLAESQSSYRTMLEKMIRDAMHQSVIYKEQVRLNQAAANALMARLEAQKAICDASEKELHKIHKQKDEIEAQIRPEWDQMRKRTRIDEDLIDEQRERKPVLYLPGIKPRTPLHKELRALMDEEQQKASGAHLSLVEEPNQVQDDFNHEKLENDHAAAGKIHTEETGDRRKDTPLFHALTASEKEKDGEGRKQRGKANVEKWLQMLLENAPDELPETDDETIEHLNLKYSHKEEDKCDDAVEKEEERHQNIQGKESEVSKEEIVEEESSKLPEEREKVKIDHVSSEAGSGRKFEGKERKEKEGKGKGLVRSESARILRRIPSSPSIILGMKKGVDCIRKKPVVFSDDECDQTLATGGRFFRSPFKIIKKAVKA